jgi:hypothetical protein
MLFALLGCTGTVDQPADTDEGSDTELVASVPEHLFTFVVIADPHITPGLENQERLAAAVAWLNDHAAEHRLELAVVVGDVGWGGGLPIAKALLDELDVPYLPLIGDNEVHVGEAEVFGQVFGPVWEALADQVDGMVSTTTQVDDPVNGEPTWLYNVALGYRGLRFVGLDWSSRSEGVLLGESADLHDFEGGTWPWFEAELGEVEPFDAEDVLLFSHHPMHLSPAGFDQAEMARIIGLTGPISGRVAGAWAGHLHLDYEERLPDAGYDVFVTDATWDDEVKVRLVEVWEADGRFTYEQELVLVPY